MSAKGKKGGPEPKNRGGLHAVSHGLQSSSGRLGVLGDLQGPKQAREWLILSLADMGQEIGKFTGTPVRKGTLSNWELGRRKIPVNVLAVYCDLIAEQISKQLGRRIEISIDANSPWKVSAYRQCHCGQWFKMHDANSKNCPRCRRTK